MATVTFPPALGGDGSTVTDDSNPTTGLGNGGHRERFVPALEQAVVVMEGAVSQATAQVALATEQADDAAESALTAVNAPGTSGTSASSIAIPTSGLPVTRSGTTQAGKAWADGQIVRLSRTSAPSNFIHGPLTYDDVTGAFSISVTHAQGVGTYTDWTLSLTGAIMSTVANAVVSRSGNFTSYKYEKGQVNDCSASLTVSLDQIATLEQGWYNYYTAPASGTVTIGPNGSEQIGGPGLTTGNTQTIKNGESCVVIAGASAFTMIRFQAKSGMELVATLTPTAAASLDFLTTLTSEYDWYLVTGQGIKSNTAGAETLLIRLANAGVVDSGSNYVRLTLDTTSSTTATSFDTGLVSQTGAPGNGVMNFELTIKNVNSTNTKGIACTGEGAREASTYGNATKAAAYTASATVSGFRLLWSGGASFQAVGLIRVYGMRNS